MTCQSDPGSHPKEGAGPADHRYGRYFQTEHLATDLRGRSVRGGALTVFAQASRLVLGIGATAVLARILTPRDFGLLAMVAGFTNFVASFKDMGLAMATVQRKDINHDQVSTLFWVNVAFGVVITLVTAALAPVVAWFYGEPDLNQITLLLVVAFTFGGLTVQHQALLRRQMKFAALAAVQIGSSTVGVVAGIVSALLGAGYWALVVMQLASHLANAIGVWLFCGWRPGRPVRGSGVRSMLAFGGNLTAANLLNYLVRNLDNVLIGWRWGADALGFYAKAYQLLLLPIRQFNAPLTSVAIPALSRLQDRPGQFRSYYQRGIQLLVTVGMPIVVFTFVAADEVVLLILGKQWTQAVPIFRILAPAAFVGTFNVATGWVYVSLGQTRRQLQWGGIGAFVTVSGFVIGLRWGPIGVAAATSIAVCVLRIPGILFCFKGTSLRLRDLFEAIWQPAVASTAAGLILAAILPLVADGQPLLWGLCSCIVVYGLAFLLAWRILPGGWCTLRAMAGTLNELRTPKGNTNDR